MCILRAKNSFTPGALASVTKLMLAGRLSLENSYIKFHENPTDGLVADIRSQADGLTDGHGLFIRVCFVTSQKMLRQVHFRSPANYLAVNTSISRLVKSKCKVHPITSHEGPEGE
jgi:hypothetical protein